MCGSAWLGCITGHHAIIPWWGRERRATSNCLRKLCPRNDTVMVAVHGIKGRELLRLRLKSIGPKLLRLRLLYRRRWCRTSQRWRLHW